MKKLKNYKAPKYKLGDLVVVAYINDDGETCANQELITSSKYKHNGKVGGWQYGGASSLSFGEVEIVAKINK